MKNSVGNISQEKKTLPRNNVSEMGKAAINYFTKLDHIFITKANKRGTTVIRDVEE